MIKLVSIRRIRLVAPEGTVTSRGTAFCPRSSQSVDLAQCEHCPFRSEEGSAPDGLAMTCMIDHVEASPAVGSLVLGPLTCVDAAMPFAALRTMHVTQRTIPVIDGPGAKYIGCISRSLLDVARELPPRVRAALLDTARVGDLTTATVAIAEGATMLEAARAMTQAGARHLPVVARDGSVAGILDDLTLLNGMSHARSAATS